MYEPAEYAAANTAGTGVLLEALLDHPVRKLVVASSMSIYGEGAYEPAPALERTREQLERGDWEPRGPNGEQLEPVPTPETQGAGARLDLRADEVRPGAHVPALRRGLRRARGRAALLQRLRPAPGALEPLHRRARDLRLAPAERPRAGRLRGRRPAARLRPRRRRRPRLPAGARAGRRRRAGRSTSAAAGAPRCSRSPRRSRACSASRSSPSSRASSAPATSATASQMSLARARRSASRPRCRSSKAWPSWPSGWRARPATDRFDEAAAELDRRGLTA